MAQRHYSSTAAAMQLQGSVNGTTATLTVDKVVGLPTSYPFTVVIDPGTEVEEIVTVTNVAGTTLTVIRGEDGTAGVPHSGGAVIRHMVTARDLREPQQHIAATTDVHGVAGSIADRLEALETLIHAVIPVGGLLPYTGDPNNVPAGFYLADGSSLLRADEPALFAVIGTTYGEGDDPGNTFALPYLPGRTVVGVDPSDSDFNSRGKTFGSKTVTLTTGQIPAHTHSMAHNHPMSHTHTVPNHTHSMSHTHGTGLSGNDFVVSTVNLNVNSTKRSFPPSGGNNHFVYANQNGSATSRSTTGPSSTSTTGSGGGGTTSASSISTTGSSSAANTGSTGSGGAHNNVQPSIALPYIIKA